MSLDEARELYEEIGENKDLQEEFEGLESEETVIDKALEIADNRGIDVSREDIEALFEELAEKAEEMDEEELEDVAGGRRSTGDDCHIIVVNTKFPGLCTVF